MWVCMELSPPNSPPSAMRQVNWEAPNAQGNDQAWTYGRTLLEGPVMIARYGRPLCELVARCLLRTPSQRPTLDELQTAITTQLLVPANATLPQAYDGRVRGGFFRDPPAPRNLGPVSQNNEGNDIDPFYPFAPDDAR